MNALTAIEPKPASIRIVALASFIVTTIEWYDFFGVSAFYADQAGPA